MITLEVRKVKRSWCVCAGKSVLGKFRTEEKAILSLDDKRDFYEYWAGSCSVSVENTESTIVYC